MTSWGIIGAGNIAHRFCDSLQKMEGSELYAISGRNQEKLDEFAKAYPCKKIYTEYENLLKDENVDAVYIALPHAMHAEWIIKAAQYGKDILCEKPAVLSASEALRVREEVEKNHVLFMEGMKNLFTPAYQQFLGRLEEIGKIKTVRLQHGFLLPKENYGKTYHTQKSAGGCLYDIGCYCLGFLSSFLEDDPKFIQTYANVQDDIDYYIDTTMKMDDVEVNMICAFDRDLESKAVIVGETGSIQVSPMHRPNRLEIIRENGDSEVLDIPYEKDDFYSEIQYFEKLRNKKDYINIIMPVASTCRTAKWSDAIREQFTKYDQNDLNILQEQEKLYTMNDITSADAFEIGSAVISLLPEYDRGVSCQIIREKDKAVIFQYIADDKNASNLMYAEGKHQSCYVYGHSSAWVYAARQVNDDFVLDEKVLPSGGSFPIFNRKPELIASILISGLHEGKDHELIIRALEKVSGKKAAQFRKALG